MILQRVENMFQRCRYVWKTDFVRALNEGSQRFKVLEPLGHSISIGIKKINDFAEASGKSWRIYEGPLVMPGWRVPLTVPLKI